MYFMERLPNDPVRNGENIVCDKKKEYLSDLLFDESADIMDLTKTDKRFKSRETEPEVKPAHQESEDAFLKTPELSEIALSPSKQSDVAESQGSRTEAESSKMLTTSTGASKHLSGTVEAAEVTSSALSAEDIASATDAEGVCTSRRSSITESLREFECSLLEMLDEEDLSLKGIEDNSRAMEEIEEGNLIKMMRTFNKTDLTTLVEEKEEDCMLPKLDLGDHREIIKHRDDKCEVNNEDNLEDIECSKERIHGTSYELYVNKTKDISRTKLESEDFEKVFNVRLKEAPPKITVEMIS